MRGWMAWGFSSRQSSRSACTNASCWRDPFAPTTGGFAGLLFFLFATFLSGGLANTAVAASVTAVCSWQRSAHSESIYQ